MPILPLQISAIEDKDAADDANYAVDETDKENVTDDDGCDDYEINDDDVDDNDDDDDDDDDDDKTGNDTLSAFVLDVMLDVLFGFIWDLGDGWVAFENTSGWGALLSCDDWKFSIGARLVLLLLATKTPVYLSFFTSIIEKAVSAGVFCFCPT